MLQNITLLINNPAIIKGLADGSLVRYGSVIRYAKGVSVAGVSVGGRIVKHLPTLCANPALGIASFAVDIIGHGMNYHISSQMNKKIDGMQQTLGQVMGLTQIAAGASVLNLGVSIAGFAYMGYQLHKVQQKLGVIQQTMETGFQQVELSLQRLGNQMTEGFTVVLNGLNHLDNRLDEVSGQLNYLYLLVEDSRQKQNSLAKGISNLHKAMLIEKIAELNAKLTNLKRFPNQSPIPAIETASAVRLFLGSQAMQSTPELDAELMLNTDVSIQGWAVATATEAQLLLEIGQHQEARQLLAEEVPKFQQVANSWGTELISNNNSALATSYRFTGSPFKEYITEERIERIKQISPADLNLNDDQIRRKKNEVEVEYQMTYAPKRYNQTWQHQQIAIAEYLDTISELTARLDSLQSFALLCEQKGVKSSKELLPDENAKPGLYLLPVD
jgi:hypothetical protein